MKVSRLPIGRRSSENLLKHAGGLLTIRTLDSVDLRFAVSSLGINAEFNLGHITPSEFDSDLDRLPDPLFYQSPAKLLCHLSCRCLVILILQPDNEVLSQTMIEIHIVDHGNVSGRCFLETYIGEEVMVFHIPSSDYDVGCPGSALVPPVEWKIRALRNRRESDLRQCFEQ